jgi:hypothetical protein
VVAQVAQVQPPKGGEPAMGKALSLAKNEIEDAGLFDSM